MMKKRLIALSVGGMMASAPVMADTVAGVYAGVQGWRTGTNGGFADDSTFANDASMTNLNFDDKTNTALYIAFEHPVPFVPNLKVNHTSMDTEGTTNLQTTFTFDGELYTVDTDVFSQAELTATDIILYYELFDNDLVSFDLGINGKYVDGRFLIEDEASGRRGEESFSGVVPMVYSRVQVGLPFSGLGAYAEGSYLSFDDHTLSDYQIALTYSFIESLAIDMTVQLGYRNVTVDIEDLDGVYADLEYDGAFAGVEVHF